MGTNRNGTSSSKQAARAHQQITKDSTHEEAPPDYLPRWEYWREMPTVELHEGIALSCNIEPEAIAPTGEFHEPDLETFNQRLEVAKRSFPAHQHPNGVPLADFVRWAVGKAGSPLWKDLPKEFRELLQDAREDTELGTRERDTLLKIIISLAKCQNVNLAEPYKAGGVIESLTEAAGLRVSARTIGKLLARATLLTTGRPARPHSKT